MRFCELFRFGHPEKMDLRSKSRVAGSPEKRDAPTSCAFGFLSSFLLSTLFFFVFSIFISGFVSMVSFAFFTLFNNSCVEFAVSFFFRCFRFYLLTYRLFYLSSFIYYRSSWFLNRFFIMFNDVLNNNVMISVF